MVHLAIRRGLAFVSAMLYANNQQLQIDDVLLDTGAGVCIFRTDYLLTLGVVPTQADRVRFMSGVGGRESVIEKQIDRLMVGNLTASPFTIQLGAMDYGLQMNGIIGMDFLLQVGALLDLRQLMLS